MISLGGVANARKGIKVISHFEGAQPSAGWMNALDEAGIPATVFEAIYLNNRDHVAYIASNANARKLARAIGRAIVIWLNQATNENME